ncbi:MAG TPA: alpha/beta fold hydrolase [Pyrinomonadaceae bacterium]|nr:alpha/beta fold hydrolase [Pyrinomonadaceae bacterium]
MVNVMKRLLLLICSLLLLTSTAAASDIKKEKINSQGKNRTYYLFVPDNVTAAKPVPLIVLLHGSNRNGLSQVEMWKELAAREGFIIAGPDSLNSSGWSEPQDGPDFIHDLITELELKYPVNPRRVYLFGHSAGAIFALYISLLESEYFAAIAIHAGALPRQAFKLIDEAKRKVPVAIFVGTDDPFFPLTDVRATRDALQQRGFTVHLTEIPGHDHNYYGIASKINNDAWGFLKNFELQADPRYEQYNFSH